MVTPENHDSPNEDAIERALMRKVFTWAAGVVSGLIVLIVGAFTIWSASTLSKVEHNQGIILSQLPGLSAEIKEQAKKVQHLDTRVVRLEWVALGERNESEDAPLPSTPSPRSPPPILPKRHPLPLGN